MDELKKYIQHHADELNLDEPRPQVWQNIRHKTEPVKKTTVVVVITRWAAAACILALAGAGAWYVFGNKQGRSVETIAKTEKVKPQTVPAETVATEKTQPGVIAKTESPVKNNHPKNIAAPVNSKADLGTLHNIENSFIQVINLQRARISSMPMYAETPEYFSDFKIQVRQMEKDEKVIRSDMAKHGMNDALLDQLINLYQQKLNILKQLQTEMNKTNNRYKQNRGPVDSARTYFLNL